MKSVLLGLLVVLLAVAAIIVTRTLLHTPASAEPVAPVTIALDEQRIAARLSRAIRFPTVSHQDPAQLDEAAFTGFIDWVRATWPEVHDAMELHRLGYTLLFEWRGTNPDLEPILLTGHYDVVPVLPGTENRWREPPFAGKVVDGAVWGRGALDDKSGVVAILEAAAWLVRSGFTPERSIYLSFGHDEEVGGEHGAGAVRRFLEERGVQLAWSLDEGSFVFDGLLPGVEPLLAAINVAEKGSVTLEIVATAEGGHSSLPPTPTAVGRLAEAITRLEQNPVPGGIDGLSRDMLDTVSRHMAFMPRMLFANLWLFGGILEDRLSAAATTNALLRTTTAPTMLSASVKTNVLPIEAVATVNFRIHPRDSVEGVIDYVRSVVENEAVTVRLAEESGRPASEVSDAGSEGFVVVGRAVREVYGDVIVAPGLMVAASDTRHYGQVADNAFRFNPVLVSRADLNGLHGTNEKISVATLAQAVRTYIQVMRHGAGEAVGASPP